MMDNKKSFKSLLIVPIILLIIFIVSSCDNTILDIYTHINTNYSGTRTIDIAVRTQYLKKGEIVLSGDETIYDKILEALPKGKIETYEKDDYTHFKTTIEFDDINFLQHFSIDNYSGSPPDMFYARMHSEDYFFYSDYFFYDYIDMKIDEAIINIQGENSELARTAHLFSADDELLQITYQVKFPVKIIDSNADFIGENNIAVWNLKFGEQRNINIEGKRTKYLSYILLAALGLVVIFILFLLTILSVSRKKRRIVKTKKSYYGYDNYFKKDNYSSPEDDRQDY